MSRLIGRSISPGYAQGTAFLLTPADKVEVPSHQIAASKVSDEVRRFEQAVARSRKDLRRLERRVSRELGSAQSSIFSAHLTLLADKQFVDRVTTRIKEAMVNAQQALVAEVSDLTQEIEALDNEYLRARAQDIRDIRNRLLRRLIDHDADPFADLRPETVIVTRELLPSETIDLDRDHVVAIISEDGGETSHAAILARAMGIPAVSGVREATSQIKNGQRVLVDGQAGTVTIAPTERQTVTFADSREQYDIESQAAVAEESSGCVTSDGHHVKLLANINRPDEAGMVRQHHLDGVGLFRTEFLFIDSISPPELEHQRDVYRDVIEQLGNAPLNFRTLDLGGDKIPLFLALNHEGNPNLGMRGLRFSLAHPFLFETQLQALVGATRDNDLGLMFPMVLGESDLRQGIERLDAIAERHGCTKRPRVGAMIETPSSLFCLDKILKLVDFISIGTNDLTQFMLAADRNAARLADDYSVLHPSVLRAIRTVADACKESGCDVSVCGEAAGDPLVAGLLVGMGIQGLSMSPVRSARVRQRIRKSSLRDLQQLADEALEANSVQSVERLLHEHAGTVA